jgi:hypothetical protein
MEKMIAKYKKHPEKKYKVYRPYVIYDEDTGRRILIPGDIVRCTEITAMCINTMQPMTMREIKAEAKE